MPNGTSSSKPRLLVLVGLPGSGKSTWAALHGYPAMASDEMRRLLIDDPTDQNIHGRVFASLRYLLRHRFQLGRPVTCVDATNLTRRERRGWIKLAELYGILPEAVYFDVALEVCVARNRARQRVVPEDALQMMAAKLSPPSLEEGFVNVTVVRD